MTSTKEQQAVATSSDEVATEQAIDAILNGTPLPAAPDADSVSRGIILRILEATPETLFERQELDAWNEHLGRPAEVLGLHLNRSTVEQGEGGSPVYAVVDVNWLDDGEKASVTCGGRNVLAQLVRAHQLGLIPGVRVKLSASRTGEGYQVLWLESV